MMKMAFDSSLKIYFTKGIFSLRKDDILISENERDIALSMTTVEGFI